MPRPQNDFTPEFWQETGLAVGQLHRAFEGYRDLMVTLTGLSIRGPSMRNAEYLVTVKALDEEGAPVVAFHSATTLMELLAGLEARLSNGTLRWRSDEFAR